MFISKENPIYPLVDGIYYSLPLFIRSLVQLEADEIPESKWTFGLDIEE